MPVEIKTISLLLPYRLGNVNCYLIKTDTGFILVDTGSSNQRMVLENKLENTGCKPGDLKMIILTHGDFDHTGNAAYLGKRFGSKIVMHESDSGMLESGDMFWNRKKGNRIIRGITPLLFGFGKSNRIKPDFFVDDGYDFSEYGFTAKVLSTPGHSKGSIGVLTANGDMFCGDLFENRNHVRLNLIMDDLEAAISSVEKLKGLKINMVYPGHGKPFSMNGFLKIPDNHITPGTT